MSEEIDSLRKRLRESLREACASLPEGCIRTRTYAYRNGTVDSEVRIAVPSSAKLREFLLTIEETFQDIIWPRNSWFSVMFMGDFSPSRIQGDRYDRRMRQDIIEFYPSRRNKMSTMFVNARSTASSLFRRQKTVEVAVRVFVGKKKPKRRYVK